MSDPARSTTRLPVLSRSSAFRRRSLPNKFSSCEHHLGISYKLLYVYVSLTIFEICIVANKWCYNSRRRVFSNSGVLPIRHFHHNILLSLSRRRLRLYAKLSRHLLQAVSIFAIFFFWEPRYTHTVYGCDVDTRILKA